MGVSTENSIDLLPQFSEESCGTRNPAFRGSAITINGRNRNGTEKQNENEKRSLGSRIPSYLTLPKEPPLTDP